MVLKKDEGGILELLGEWVFCQCYVGCFFVVVEGIIEKPSKSRQS